MTTHLTTILKRGTMLDHMEERKHMEDRRNTPTKCAHCTTGTYVRSWGEVSCLACGHVPPVPGFRVLPKVPDAEIY